MLGGPNNCHYIVVMVIELVNDNLIDFFGDEKVIVVFSSESCRACKELKPYLNEIPDEYTVINVDCLKNIMSPKYYPKTIKYYPTIALFINGHFNKDLTQLDIFNKNFE